MILFLFSHVYSTNFLAAALIADHYLILQVVVKGVPGHPLCMLLHVILTTEKLGSAAFPRKRALQTEETHLLSILAGAEGEVVEIQVFLLD